MDEILFENRNREYGAYVLRHEADRILTKSLFIGVGLFAAVSSVPLIINAFKTAEPVIVIDHPGPIDLDNVDRPDIIKPDPVLTPPVQKIEKTIDTRVPEPKAKPVNEKPAVTVKAYDDAKAGTKDIEGEKPTTSYTTPVVNPGPVVAPTPTPAPAAQPKADPEKIVEKVDVEAGFSGGIDGFRNKVVSGFDTSAFEGTGDLLKTNVTFVVERDGTISNIKAVGPDAAFNREAERTIKAIKGKWNPAKVQGEAVRSRFRFPISMKFE